MQGSGVTCIFSEKLFGLVAAITLAWLQQDNETTVGLVLLYRKSVEILEAWRQTLYEGWQRRVTVATPKQVQGDCESYPRIIHRIIPSNHTTHSNFPARLW